MEQEGDWLDPETFSCSMCLDVLKDAVTIPCGHSYCMKCIEDHWDEEDQKGIHSCPQCRKYFILSSDLEIHTFADLLEEIKKTGPEADHDEEMKIFCYTDQQLVYHICPSEEHEDHDTVSAAAERAERQRELQVRREEIQQGILDGEKDVQLLQQELEAISQSADETVEDSEKIFTELIHLIQKRSSDVKQQIRSQQETEVSRVKELQEKLEQQITELKRKDAELEQLSNTEDHSQFLQNYPSESDLRESPLSSSIRIRPLRYFEDVTAAISELRDQLQDVLRDTWRNISLTVTEVDVLLPQPEPERRSGLLKYSCDITLDPNTVNPWLLLSEENRKVTVMTKQQPYSDHPDRFSLGWQVLSRDSLTGRCYWEVEWSGIRVYIAVSYKNISRTGSRSIFGHNDKSWALDCYKNSYTFLSNNIWTFISGPCSSRIGVYLDHRAGVLSFYSVSDTMTLLHRVQTRFSQPLHAGLWISNFRGDTAEFCELK